MLPLLATAKIQPLQRVLNSSRGGFGVSPCWLKNTKQSYTKKIKKKPTQAAPTLLMEALSKGQPWLGIPKALLEFLPMERLPGLAVPRLGLAHPWHLWAVPTAGPGAAPVGLEAPWE